MKVLLYLHANAGGHWTYVTELAGGLSSLTETIVVAPRGSAPLAGGVRLVDRLTPIDLTVRGWGRLVDRLRVYWSHPKEFEGVLLEERNLSQPGVVHFQQLPTIRARALVQLAKARGYRTVITVHNVSPHKRTFGSWLFQQLRLRAYRSADLLIVHSESLRAKLRVALPRACIQVVPHPIWPVAVPDAVPSRDFLFFGVLRENKGVHLFVEALVLLGDPSASIVGFGEPHMVDWITRLVGDAGLENCRLCFGFVADSDVGDVFASHAVLVAPYTHFEAQSGVTHLALAHRRALVVSDVGALGDLVREFGVGLVVVNNNPESLASGMAEVRARYSHGDFEGRFDEAADSLSIAGVAQATLDCYEYCCRE